MMGVAVGIMQFHAAAGDGSHPSGSQETVAA